MIAGQLGNQSRATVTTGFAIKMGQDVVYGLLPDAATANGSALDFYFNGDLVDNLESFEGESISIQHGENNSFTATAGETEVVITPHVSHLFLQVAIADVCFNRTDGLMGNNNGNASDDLRPFNSVDILAENSSLEEIYEKFVPLGHACAAA